jgi:hypothetical protein
LEKLVQKDIEVWTLNNDTSIVANCFFGCCDSCCFLFFLGTLPNWANWWGCHSELTDLQREEVCWYKQRGPRIGWGNGWQFLSLFIHPYFHHIMYIFFFRWWRWGQ